MSRSLLLAVLALLILCPTSAITAKVLSQAKSQQEAALIPPTGPDAFTGCAGPIIPPSNPDYEQAIVEQTNEIRMEADLSPLKRRAELDNSARYHTADMSNNNYFSHNTFDRKDTRTTEVCDTWHRIQTYYPGWLALAENIAAGQRSPKMAMDGWMNSPDHRHNILSDNYSEIGVGFYQGNGEYRYYWAQNFGRADGRYPIVIDGEKARTSQQVVSLYIYGEWNEVRFRNDSGEWGDWQPFQQTMTWSLPPEPGVHTVTAEMRSGLETATASDEIELVGDMEQ